MSGDRPLKAHVEIHLPEDKGEDQVSFTVTSPDGRALTGNQIVEAVAEAVLLYWENNPLEAFNLRDFDA